MHRCVPVLAVTLLAVATTAGCGGVSSQSMASAQPGQGAVTLTAGASLAGNSSAGTPGSVTDGRVSDGGSTATAPGTPPTTPGTGARTRAAGGATVAPAPTGPGGVPLPLGITLDEARATGLGTDRNPVVAVVRTRTTCQAGTATVPAGKVWFTFVNRSRATSMLVLRTTTGVGLIALDQVAPGGTGAFPFILGKGTYQLACAAQDGTRLQLSPLSVTPAKPPARK